MMQKVTTMQSLVALLYLMTAAGPTLALPIAGPAPGDFFLERSAEKREAGPVKGGLAIDYKREPHRGGGRDAEPEIEERDLEVEARAPGVRQNAVMLTKREPSAEPQDKREPSAGRTGSITKREPSAEPGVRQNAVMLTKRSPSAEPSAESPDKREASAGRSGVITKREPSAEPGVRQNAVMLTKRSPSAEPDDRFGNVIKREPSEDKREPSAGRLGSITKKSPGGRISTITK